MDSPPPAPVPGRPAISLLVALAVALLALSAALLDPGPRDAHSACVAGAAPRVTLLTARGRHSLVQPPR